MPGATGATKVRWLRVSESLIPYKLDEGSKLFA